MLYTSNALQFNCLDIATGNNCKSWSLAFTLTSPYAIYVRLNSLLLFFSSFLLYREQHKEMRITRALKKKVRDKVMRINENKYRLYVRSMTCMSWLNVQLLESWERHTSVGWQQSYCNHVEASASFSTLINSSPLHMYFVYIV